MAKISVELSRKQAEELLNQLPPAVKIVLVRRWAKETWAERFHALEERVAKRLRENPSLKKRALKAIAPARRSFYARRYRY